MRKLEQKETPRELTDEETKAVSGGTSPNSQPNPGWSNQGGGGAGNTWRETPGHEK
jgi:hypothetical protein